jgi:hypothetical protein
MMRSIGAAVRHLGPRGIVIALVAVVVFLALLVTVIAR